MAISKNYKDLYNKSTKQLAEKDSLIVLMQQQIMQLASGRDQQYHVIADQQAQLKDQEQLIQDQQIVLAQQQQTIAGQAEKLSEIVVVKWNQQVQTFHAGSQKSSSAIGRAVVQVQ